MTGTGWVWAAVWGAVGAFGLGGLVLLYVALLHDCAGRRRRCPKCWYDMAGVATSFLCSECGHEAADERMLRRTRRRPWLACLGAMLLLLSVGAAVRFAGMDTQQYKPVWLLTWEMHADGSRGSDARRELIRRGRNGALSISQQQRLADRVLDVQADLRATWDQRSYPPARDESWAAVFEEAWRRGALRDEHVQQYLRTGFEAHFFFDHRARVRARRNIPVRFGTTGPPRLYRWASLDPTRDPLRLRVVLESVTGVDTLLPRGPKYIIDSALPSETFPRNVHVLDSENSAFGWTTSTLPGINSPGRHEVTIELTFEVTGDAASLPGVDAHTVLAQWSRTETFTVEVLPRDMPAVDLIDDPSLEQVIRDALIIELTGNAIVEGGRTYGNPRGMILVRPIPIAIGFDVFGRSGDQEEFLGSISAAGDSDHIQYTRPLPRDPRSLFEDASIDIIMRANPEAAEGTVDIDAIWNGELTFENVRLIEPKP